MKLCLTVVVYCAATLVIYAQTMVPSPDLERIEIVLDSIRTVIAIRVDSLNEVYQSPQSGFDSLRSSLQRKLDTLYWNTIETSKIRQSIDSINQQSNNIMARLNADLETLKSKTIGQLHKKINDLNLPPQLNEKISSLTKEIEKISIQSNGLNLSNIIPTSDLPVDLSDLNLNSSLPALADGTNVVGDVSTNLSVPGVISSYGTDIQQLAKGEPNAINTLSSTAEQKAVELSGMSAIQNQTEVFDDYKEQLSQIRNPEELKEQGVEKLQQAAMDHFAGKQQVLQEAMDKMSKYKDKYASLTSLTDVPFKRPNEMRGKPLIERLVPAFMVQIQKEGNNLLIDFNPYVGYRFTGKLTAGAGWNQRIAYDNKLNAFTSQSRIYGPRIFADYNLWKGFYPRVEVEVMNAMVAPPDQPSRMDLGSREWVWGVFFGVKKEYRFIKNVKGTALVMTRLFDPNHKSPYSDVLNVRIGFEFPMKKKVRKTPS